MSKKIGTGIYHNKNTFQWEAWVVNVSTGEETLLGACDDIIPKEERDIWEKEIWKNFIGKLMKETS